MHYKLLVYSLYFKVVKRERFKYPSTIGNLKMTAFLFDPNSLEQLAQALNHNPPAIIETVKTETEIPKDIACILAYANTSASSNDKGDKPLVKANPDNITTKATQSADTKPIQKSEYLKNREEDIISTTIENTEFYKERMERCLKEQQLFLSLFFIAPGASSTGLSPAEMVIETFVHLNLYLKNERVNGIINYYTTTTDKIIKMCIENGFLNEQGRESAKKTKDSIQAMLKTYDPNQLDKSKNAPPHISKYEESLRSLESKITGDQHYLDFLAHVYPIMCEAISQEVLDINEKQKISPTPQLTAIQAGYHIITTIIFGDYVAQIYEKKQIGYLERLNKLMTSTEAARKNKDTIKQRALSSEAETLCSEATKLEMEKLKSYCEVVACLEKTNVHRIYHDTAYGFLIQDDNELFERLK